MPRTPKNGGLCRDTDLRIPVTSEQKALIQEATSDEPEGMASWARGVLIQAARKKVENKPREDQEKTKTADPSSQDLKFRFQKLASQWKKETAHQSSLAVKADHQAYQEILSLGKAVVPLILADLKDSRAMWFPALRELTGANPVPEESRGVLQEMVDAWLQWGRGQGYVV